MSAIEVTNVSVNRLKSSTSKIVGFVDITINNAIVIRGLKLVSGQKGVFVAFPSQKNKDDGKFYDTVFPINREVRKVIEDAVMAAYEGNTTESPKEAKPKPASSPKSAADDFFN